MTIPLEGSITEEFVDNWFTGEDLSDFEEDDKLALWLMSGRTNPNFDEGWATYIGPALQSANGSALLPEIPTHPIYWTTEVEVIRDSPVFGNSESLTRRDGAGLASQHQGLFFLCLFLCQGIHLVTLGACSNVQ